MSVFSLSFRAKAGTARGRCVAAGMDQLVCIPHSSIRASFQSFREKVVLLTMMKAVIFS